MFVFRYAHFIRLSAVWRNVRKDQVFLPDLVLLLAVVYAMYVMSTILSIQLKEIMSPGLP